MQCIIEHLTLNSSLSENSNELMYSFLSTLDITQVTIKTLFAHHYRQNILMYQLLINKIEKYFNVFRIASKGHLSIGSLQLSKLNDILKEVKLALQEINPSYGIVIEGHHLYYDTPLITFAIDKKSNLIIQFPIFTQPFKQNPLHLNQLETVLVSIDDKNQNVYPFNEMEV